MFALLFGQEAPSGWFAIGLAILNVIQTVALALIAAAYASDGRRLGRRSPRSPRRPRD